MRIFIGIQLDRSMKEKLRYLQKEVKEQSTKGRFTRIDNFHLTLRFIGEMDEQQLKVLKEEVSRAVQLCTSFQLEMNQLGWFTKKSGIIPWAGVKENPALQELYDRVSEALEELGIPRDFPVFTPHMTLGRNVRLETAAQSRLKNKEITEAVQEVKEITIYQSHQVEEVLTYTPLAVFPLGGEK